MSDDVEKCRIRSNNVEKCWMMSGSSLGGSVRGKFPIPNVTLIFQTFSELSPL